MPTISKATPVLVVSDVESCAKFWDAQGFTRVAEVPHGDSLGFIIMSSGSTELMYQSLESIIADDATMGSHLRTGGSSLFVEVPDLDACVRAAADAPIILAERKTFYGMREVGMLDPGGNVVLFAQRIE